MAAITVREMSVFSQRKRAYRDQRIVKYSHHRRNAVNPLESKSQIDQHPGQRIQRGQNRLLPQLTSNLRANNLNISHAKIGEEESVLHHASCCGIDPDAFQLIERSQHAAIDLVAEVDDRLRLRCVFWSRVRAQMQRILSMRIVFMLNRASIVQVLLPGGRIRFQRLDDLGLTLIQGLLVGFLQSRAISTSLLAGWSVALNLGRSSVPRGPWQCESHDGSGVWANFTYTSVPPRKSTP